MMEFANREYVLYLRKSSGKAGIDRQRDRATREIGHLGGTVTREFCDEDSTAYQHVLREDAPPRRDDFRAMLDLLAARPGLGVAAYHPDRLMRSMADTEALIRICGRGANPVVTSEGSSYDLTNSNGQDQFWQAGLRAASEVARSTERILDAKVEARAGGNWLGGPRPFGWMPDGITLCHRELHCTQEEAARRGLEPAGTVRTRNRTLAVVQLPYDEAAEFASALRRITAGESLSSIHRDWAGRGILSATGRPWAAAVNIRRALASPRTAGLATHEGVITGPGRWEPVTDELTWRRASAILTDPERCTTPGPARRWLGSGLYLCGVCQEPAGASSTHSGRGERVRRAIYLHRGHVARDAVALDAWVGSVIAALLSRPEVIEALRGDGPDTGPLQLEVERVTAEMDAAAAAAASGEITIRQLAIASAGLLERKAAAEAELAAAARTGIVGELLGPDPGPALWDALTLDGRRALLSALLTVTILPAPRGRPAGWKPGQPYLSAMTDYIRIEPRYEVAG